MRIMIAISLLFAQTISEKKAALEDQALGMSRIAYQELSCVNAELKRAKDELKHLYEQAGEVDPKELLTQIREIRREIQWIEEAWREAAQKEGKEGPYALWHQPSTTVEQLIIDYGSADYVYLIPKEIGDIPLSCASNLPVPRETWSNVLSIMLQNVGVGIEQASPLVRRLYLIDNQKEAISAITSDRIELKGFPPTDRVCFVLSGEGFDFLSPFVNPETTALYEVAGQLFICASVQEVEKILKIYAFVEKSVDARNYELISLNKISAQDMSAILAAQMETLHILSVEGSALFLSGCEKELKRAKEMIQTVEAQLNNPREMTVYTYTCLHSDPEELGDALREVYELMGDQQRGNFVVYPKTGSIVMVVEQDLLAKLKRLLNRIDVPRKMVQIDVLFFEKKLTGQSRFGLDFLRFGKSANGQAKFSYRDGILSFLIGSKSPRFDLAYQFLLSQDDVRINAHPSVTTMNQTSAMIQLVDEISIDTGAVLLKGSERLKRSFTRTEYGITLKITPTVHSDAEGGELIHLETDVLFDTIGSTKGDHHRPPVSRRHITNEVRVADGETVVLGGLRSKESQDSSAGLPFLGELPYIGKLFGGTHMRDQETEMFIFITPRIVQDPAEEIRRMRAEELMRRPGDHPEFLEKLEEGKRSLCKRSLRAMLGRRI